MQRKYDVIIIGAGAAGLMAAISAGRRGKSVLVLEKNPLPGKKLSISGGGRCNITHAQHNEHVLLSHYGGAGKALFSTFHQFGVVDTFRLFESLGLPLVVEEGNRAFPHTQRAQDVVDVLTENAMHHGAQFVYSAPVDAIECGDVNMLVSAGGKVFHAQTVIVACGGVSHPETGSTGDAFPWLRGLGHTIAKPTPSVVPLRVGEPWLKKMSGTSLEDVKITFFCAGTKAFAKRGRILCTHFGISGPLILNNAHAVADLMHRGQVTAQIDLFPSLDHGGLDKQLVKLIDAHKRMRIVNVLAHLLPPGCSSLWYVIAPGVSELLPAQELRKEDRQKIVSRLKALPITITGLMGMDKAVIADGGVPVGEIDMRTMRSRIVPRLAIVGDMLHINRPSGGFSLQLCWTTGWVAGLHA